MRVDSYVVGRKFRALVERKGESGCLARGLGHSREAAEAGALEQAELTLEMRRLRDSVRIKRGAFETDASR